MHIAQLTAQGFRNLTELSLSVSPQGLLIEGDNGQGKTNLLEALYLCATGKSFRQTTPADLLQYGRDAAHISARFERQSVAHRIEVALGPLGKRICVDDRHVRSSAQLLTHLNVVAFFPEDLAIAKGGPEQRRRFLDRAVANFDPEFARAAVTYARALRQRNALLRQPRLDRTLLAVFDEQLVTSGVKMHQAREALLAALQPFVQETQSGLWPGCRIRASLDSGFGDDLGTELAANVAEDRRRGATSRGPHRADLVLEWDDKLVRSFASQGQQRAMVLALKIAELVLLNRTLGSAPILLLDDVSSELDATRRQALFSAVRALGCQVWVSTTDARLLPSDLHIPKLRVFQGRFSGYNE